MAVRAVEPSDRAAVARLLAERWGSTTMVSRGACHDASALPGFVAVHAGRILGLVTYVVAGAEVELVTLDSLREGSGIGSALVAAVAEAAAGAGARRMVLVTTNDNLRALGFYQRRGFRLVHLHAGAVDRARERKPSIPRTGNDGIPIHDELELACDLPAPSRRTRPLRDPVQ